MFFLYKFNDDEISYLIKGQLMINYYKMQRLHNNRYFCLQNSLLEDKNWITVVLYLKFLCNKFLVQYLFDYNDQQCILWLNQFCQV